MCRANVNISHSGVDLEPFGTVEMLPDFALFPEVERAQDFALLA